MPADTAVLANVVVLPIEVTSPLRLAFNKVAPDVKPVAVPVMLVPTRVVGVPNDGA